MALALYPPIASQFTSEVILEKTNDGDTIHNFERENLRNKRISSRQRQLLIIQEVRDSDFYNQLGQQIGMCQFPLEHPQDCYNWFASIKQDGKNLIVGNDSTNESFYDMSLNKSISAQFIDAIMSKVKRGRVYEENIENLEI
ncbi:MAG: hypothetical protein EZS28_012787 [Streblomastix strix]|uniref:Uncharacterized protein n=1 Tax=Streblomastix strix TaxID=222440 RepID=A0A5J4WBF5_9EUKA|nr:MAG: hypothetical protein EZS28_012787 [Streblomastix strix]